MSDPRALLENEVFWNSGKWDPSMLAIAAVLELKPPEADPGDDLETHELATDGWWTCHHAVVRAITNALGDTDAN